MARLGPWDGARRVALAVSGGPDSLALALLAKAWGDPVAFIVDHRLRAASGAEAQAARTTLLDRGIPTTVLVLDNLTHGPGLASRARVARYAALTKACREAGLVDLLLGHHAGDQAETVLMRRRRGSGPFGLAGMAALTETLDLRLLRPLLAATPNELRALVDAAGLVPADDPSNTDARSTRVALRREIGADRAELLGCAAKAAQDRATAERAVAAELAERASLYPEGYAVLSPGQVSPAALSALIRSVSGQPYAARTDALAAAPQAATLGGTRLQPAGQAGPGWLVTREERAFEAPVQALPGAVWDGRFRVAGGRPDSEIGALGAGSASLRRLTDLPNTVLRALPAIRTAGLLVATPHIGYLAPGKGIPGLMVRSGTLPAAGAAFLAC